jgi:hypothetical protein
MLVAMTRKIEKYFIERLATIQRRPNVIFQLRRVGVQKNFNAIEFLSGVKELFHRAHVVGAAIEWAQRLISCVAYQDRYVSHGFSMP